MNALNLTGRLLGIFAVSLLIAACATPPDDPEARAEYEEVNDPFEPTNRVMFEFNRGLDTVLFKPLAKAYLHIPEEGRKALHNAILNIEFPVTFTNALFQGDIERAGNALGRFLINTTIGIGGLFDPATRLGIPYLEEDFGQTLAVWGNESGPYIVIPIFGPSNPRDIVGAVVDGFLDPLTYVFWGQDAEVEYALSRGGIEGVDERSRVIDVLDDIEETSLDFYATIRSLHRQRRDNQIRNGERRPDLPGPSLMTGLGGGGGSNKASLAR